MASAPEVAWIVPVVVPLFIGLLVGFIVKRTVKLLFALAALVLLLVVVGAVSLTYQDLFDQALTVLPRIIGTGSGFVDALPYTSLTFLLGLVLGLWRG